jgi:cold shock CspA family protein
MQRSKTPSQDNQRMKMKFSARAQSQATRVTNAQKAGAPPRAGPKSSGPKKPPPAVLHGEVVRLNGEGGYGFIRTPEGNEYYFNHDSVVGMPFAHIQADAKVQFIPEVGFEELHAKRVSLIKHGAG